MNLHLIRGAMGWVRIIDSNNIVLFSISRSQGISRWSILGSEYDLNHHYLIIDGVDQI